MIAAKEDPFAILLLIRSADNLLIDIANVQELHDLILPKLARQRGDHFAIWRMWPLGANFTLCSPHVRL